MKNTKKYMSAGLALTIALFSSVQMFAMQQRYYLTENDKTRINKKIDNLHDSYNDAAALWKKANELGDSARMDRANQMMQKIQNKTDAYIKLITDRSYDSREDLWDKEDVLDSTPTL